jgi:hypothetical protein
MTGEGIEMIRSTLQLEDGRWIRIERSYMLSRWGNTLGERVRIIIGAGANREVSTYKFFGLQPDGAAETKAVTRWLAEHPTGGQAGEADGR